MNYLFYHAFCINDCFERFLSTINKIKNSGLYESTEKIYLNIVGKDIGYIERSNFLSLVNENEKIELSIDPENTIGEGSTLNLMWKKCQELGDRDNILYIHSKGVWRSREKSIQKENIQAWTDLMEFFLIERWEKAISYLTDHDACGVNLQSIKEGHQHPHFSGNFWWASNSYIKKTRSFSDYFDAGQEHLEVQPIEKRIYAEWWLLNSSKEGIANPYCLYDSRVNHYTTFYDRSNYSNL